jgi:hypothetical protein
MKTEKLCRHCGESFSPAHPPERTFGKYIDECSECSDALYRPQIDLEIESTAETKARLQRKRLEASLSERGWTASRIAERMQDLRDVADL